MAAPPLLLWAALLCGARTALACNAQVSNAVFIQARSDVARMKSEGKLSPAQTREWVDLEAEQKNLWARAGRIDDECRAGRLSEDAVPYNAAVLDWETRLRRFLLDIASPVPDPTASAILAPSQNALDALGKALDSAGGSGDGGAETRRASTGPSELSFPGTSKRGSSAPATKAMEPPRAAASPPPLLLK